MSASWPEHPVPCLVHGPVGAGKGHVVSSLQRRWFGQHEMRVTEQVLEDDTTVLVEVSDCSIVYSALNFPKKLMNYIYQLPRRKPRMIIIYQAHMLSDTVQRTMRRLMDSRNDLTYVLVTCMPEKISDPMKSRLRAVRVPLKTLAEVHTIVRSRGLEPHGNERRIGLALLAAQHHKQTGGELYTLHDHVRDLLHGMKTKKDAEYAADMLDRLRRSGIPIDNIVMMVGEQGPLDPNFYRELIGYMEKDKNLRYQHFQLRVFTLFTALALQQSGGAARTTQ